MGEELFEVALGEDHLGLFVRVALGEYFEFLVAHDV